MSDINCPYCKATQEINHDDGYGYDEDEMHEQECSECGKNFKFTTSIMYHYEVYCQNEDHDMQPFGDKWPGMYGCENCEFYELRKD